jgi:hypothetical protein
MDVLYGHMGTIQPQAAYMLYGSLLASLISRVIGVSRGRLLRLCFLNCNKQQTETGHNAHRKSPMGTFTPVCWILPLLDGAVMELNRQQTHTRRNSAFAFAFPQGDLAVLFI